MNVLAEVGACCVAEVMGTELYTLTPDTTASAARRLANDNGIDHLLVLDNGTLAGIVCRDDLRLAGSDSLVRECMSSPVLCIGPDTTLDEAAQIMADEDVSCLPVVTGTFLVGIVTRSALDAGGLTTRNSATIRQTCRACGSHREVRKDIRAAGLLLCASCQGRTITTAADEVD